MSEEENKAIKSLNDFAYTIHGTLSVGESKTILNLIKNLQKENTLAKETIKNHCSDMDKVNNILAKLKKENEELSRLNEKLEMEYNILLNAKVAIDIGSTESVGIEFLEEYIPKSVIQDKIEEIINNPTYGYVGCEWNDIEVVQLLKNMLEGEE